MQNHSLLDTLHQRQPSHSDYRFIASFKPITSALDDLRAKKTPQEDLTVRASKMTPTSTSSYDK